MSRRVGILVAVAVLSQRVLMAGGGAPLTGLPDQGRGLPGAFAKYGSNPIIPTVPATWESVNVAAPDVKWDSRQARWVMNYSGFDGSTWRTGLAYSTNLLSWTKEATNPVFSPNVAEGYLAGNGSIVYYGGQYWLYYQGLDSPLARIYAATSPDMLTWTRANGGSPVLDLGAASEFDDYRTYDPHAQIAEDGTIALFYIGTTSGATSGIGWASSSDGVTFSKHGRLLQPSSPELPGWLGEPSYLGRFGHYAFLADGAQVAFNRYINRYYTTDGSTFTRELGVLQAGSGWESAIVFDCSQIWWNGVLYCFYAGAPNNTEPLGAQIGVATVAWN